ncbi:unnamed protein product [Caenorhabditis auriculariae]|uniref:Uncharacterized protein n=1 Tax=Caenorhabditis auriculariae TaxID=2777116 RepID=A0A8S1H8W3_9PELO|nr:unnamed protein product [Caenorhabditis auriculariae]
MTANTTLPPVAPVATESAVNMTELLMIRVLELMDAKLGQGMSFLDIFKNGAKVFLFILYCIQYSRTKKICEAHLLLQLFVPIVTFVMFLKIVKDCRVNQKEELPTTYELVIGYQHLPLIIITVAKWLAVVSTLIKVTSIRPVTSFVLCQNDEIYSIIIPLSCILVKFSHSQRFYLFKIIYKGAVKNSNTHSVESG